MIPRDHQIEGAKEALPVLLDNGIVYLQWEERTGKTLTSILTAELANTKHVLIVTKKKALKDWMIALTEYKPNFRYTIVNWHMLKNINDNFDAAIIDEPHGYLSGTPKPGKMQMKLKSLVYKASFIIHLSATPCAQGYHQLFHQLDISKHSPFAKYNNYYSFWKTYGIENTVWVSGKEREQYNKVKSEMWKDVKHLFITKTRKELGFKQEPKDQLHYIELDPETRMAYNALQKDKIIELRGKDVLADHVSKLRTYLHQLEGGTLKQHDIIKEATDKEKIKTKPRFIELKNKEKINYIKEHWGDKSSVVIMYNYIEEEYKLNNHFKNAKILHSTSYAEGIDLSSYDHLIIYSMNFSTAKYTQRRARQANIDREDDITVHYLLVKNAISEQAYNTVAVNKKNYVDSTYIEKDI